MLDDKLLGSDEEMLDEYKDVLENDKKKMIKMKIMKKKI